MTLSGTGETTPRVSAQAHIHCCQLLGLLFLLVHYLCPQAQVSAQAYIRCCQLLGLLFLLVRYLRHVFGFNVLGYTRPVCLYDLSVFCTLKLSAYKNVIKNVHS